MTLGSLLPGLIAQSPDPALAAADWEALAAFPAAVERFARSAPEEEMSALFRLLGSSPALSRALVAAGDRWPEELRAALGAESKTIPEHLRQLDAAVGGEWPSFARALRRHRQREYLRIGAGDLCRQQSVDATMTELTALADAAFEASVRWARRQLVAEYGECRHPGGAPQAFTVIGMGKLGGGELNYSSDVDVVYLYASDDGETEGGPRGSLTPREFFTRLAELVTRALHEPTGDGRVFRVDLRLRPEGINGPIANSLANVLLYYESWGATWERTALLAARPVAGDMRLGQQLLAEVRPFVYRRFLDYTTVADVKAMKTRMENELRTKARRGNVKLGPGGIREIEFVVQVLQVIHGGRDERLHVRGTLPALDRLIAGGYLPRDEGEGLQRAYRFLRDVEHKIQIVHEMQTHTVSATVEEQDTLAHRLRLGDATMLWAALDEATTTVRRAFDKLFYEPAAEAERDISPAILSLLDGLDDAEQTVMRLGMMGFTDPEARRADLLLLRDGSPSAPASQRRKEALRALAPALLSAVLKSANPDQALELVATLIASIGARASFLALLRENPGTLRMLIRLFAGSRFLAKAFLQRPDVLDTLVRADLARVRVSRDELTREIGAAFEAAGDLEARLDALRRFRNEHFLRIGINDLEGLLDVEGVGAELTMLAEVCLEAAYRLATALVCERLGVAAPPGALAIVAMGKLGTAELNYNSDLDLIFVYDAPPGAESDALEFFTKLAQRLITILQVPTREGLAYHIDTRLRPSGHHGPLVSALDAFQEYHEQSAQVWERQALIKARAVVGDPAVAGTVERIISDFVYRRALTPEETREVHRIRTRMERELARETRQQANIKTGRGGLVDIEFVTQMLQLRHGHAVPAVRLRAPAAALAALRENGILPAADYETLAGAYRFLRRLENRMRLAQDRPVDELEQDSAELAPLARHLGFEGSADEAAAALWQAFSHHREAVRACYLRWFELSRESRVESREPDV